MKDASWQMAHFDTQIRSAEPTMSGWAVCLICYPPFWDVVGASYLSYDDDYAWSNLFGASPVVTVLWGTTILLLLAVYAWSTLVFGLRFSNLTHRGIITHGPYAWMKHPAYVTKNLSWWLLSVPFFPNAGWGEALRQCGVLALLNGIYLLRAVTEERHLAADPVYREYQAFIRRNGLWARLLRYLRLGA